MFAVPVGERNRRRRAAAIRARPQRRLQRNQEGRREFGLQGERTTGGSEPMCDYSLHAVASRPAAIGDRLVTTGFANTYTRGFAGVEERTVAVCLLPGTELAFDKDVDLGSFFGLFRRRIVGKLARFRAVNSTNPQTHHDALEFS